MIIALNNSQLRRETVSWHNVLLQQKTIPIKLFYTEICKKTKIDLRGECVCPHIHHNISFVLKYG